MKTNLGITDFLLHHRPFGHLAFWVVFVLLFSFIATLNTGVFLPHLVNNLVLLPTQLIAAYSLVYYLVPNFLARGKYLRFLIYTLSTAYVLAIVARLMVVYIAEPLVREDFSQESLNDILADPLYLFGVYIPAVYLMVVLFVAVNSIKGRLEIRNQVEVLRREKANNELQLLKAQIHPHFLFNTLNNLYSLSQAQSPQAAEVVLKLSEMLDYMLYHGQESLVAIKREIALLQNYIDLESLRYGDRLNLQFEQDIDQPNQLIPPLILLPLVENAFKHGAQGDHLSPEIKISISLQDTMLDFRVYNSKPEQQPAELIPAESAGIGTKNLSRQLKLLYPNKHHLTNVETDRSYTVSLKINLG